MVQVPGLAVVVAHERLDTILRLAVHGVGIPQAHHVRHDQVAAFQPRQPGMVPAEFVEQTGAGPGGAVVFGHGHRQAGVVVLPQLAEPQRRMPAQGRHQIAILRAGERDLAVADPFGDRAGLAPGAPLVGAAQEQSPGCGQDARGPAGPGVAVGKERVPDAEARAGQERHFGPVAPGLAIVVTKPHPRLILSGGGEYQLALAEIGEALRLSNVRLPGSVGVHAAHLAPGGPTVVAVRQPGPAVPKRQQQHAILLRHVHEVRCPHPAERS